MKKTINLLSIITILALLSACARDLSSSTYSSSSTLSLTLEGVVLDTRQVTIKDSEKMSDNSAGMLAGGVLGGVAGSGIGQGTGKNLAVVGGAIGGAIAGAALEGALSKQKGIEYIIKVDTSKLKSTYYEGNAQMRSAISAATTSGVITVVQAADNPIAAGQKVYVIFSDNRTRVIPAR